MAVGRAALDAHSVEDLTSRTLTAMCEALEWDVGVFWEVDTSADVLRCRQTSARGQSLAEALSRKGAITLGRGQGLAGRVWQDGYAASAVDGFDVHPVFAAMPSIGNLRTGFAFPLLGGAGILGVFEFAGQAVEVTSSALLHAAAIIGHHISQFADRLRAEEALRESLARKAAILTTALDGLVTVDSKGCILELNAEAERTFGAETGAMLGNDLAELIVTSDDQPKLRAELAALGQGGASTEQTGRRLHVRAVRAAGEEFPADLSITRIPLDGPPHFSICIRDLSDQERLQGALHHAQKMESLGLLAGGVAHDFNNFLTVIRGQAERLIKNLPDEDHRRKWVASILKVSERASALTGQLLAFGRRELGTVSVVDVNAIVESTAALLTDQLGGVRWETTLAPDAGQARIGEGQVQQILFNLALNARDAMPDGGVLQVGTEHADLSPAEARRLLLSPGPYVLFWVTDSGRGMDARTQGRVFEPFFTTKRLGAGTGLGLSTVYAIVQQCGGHISVSSRVGRGSTFRVYLPRIVAAEAESADPSLPLAQPRLAGLTVLLVEDEDEIREIIRDSLTEHGCRVLEAGDGATALERCGEHDGPIDLLVTDVMMPEMNGHELAERIVRLRPEIPVIFVSGHPEAEIGSQRLVGRPVSLLRKPFSSDDLVQCVLDITKLDRDGYGHAPFTANPERRARYASQSAENRALSR